MSHVVLSQRIQIRNPDKVGQNIVAVKTHQRIGVEQNSRDTGQESDLATHVVEHARPDQAHHDPGPGRGQRDVVEIVVGQSGYIRAATCVETDTVLGAMVGAAGLAPTLAAIDAGKDIALANKETLVMAGGIVMQKVAEQGVTLMPVDSEHSAIFQSMEGRGDNAIHEILLTASGGPFLKRPAATFETITPQDALRHPNWSMGSKISIDSATLMNKGLEVIEARSKGSRRRLKSFGVRR